MPGRRSKREQARSALEQLRNLLLRRSQDCQTYLLYLPSGTPCPNDATEQAMGKMKMRARTMGGYKSRPGLHAGLLLAANQLA